jgi:hypothetical protein
MCNPVAVVWCTEGRGQEGLVEQPGSWIDYAACWRWTGCKANVAAGMAHCCGCDLATFNPLGV